MNVVIVCQSCKKPLKIPAEGIGKKVRCPACKAVFVGRRDEFKPRSSAAAAPQKALPVRPTPPTNDALLSDEDAARDVADDSVEPQPADDEFDDADTPATKRGTKPKKKRSWLSVILLAVAVLVLVGVLGGAAVVFFVMG